MLILASSIQSVPSIKKKKDGRQAFPAWRPVSSRNDLAYRLRYSIPPLVQDTSDAGVLEGQALIHNGPDAADVYVLDFEVVAVEHSFGQGVLGIT